MKITNEYYKNNSQDFFASTVNADVSDLYDHFLKYMPDGARILDLGCGSGRDTKAFTERGYRVDAMDGSAELCRMASEYTGIDVRCAVFSEVNSVDEYDAIWACASLLHIDECELKCVLPKLLSALKENGIMYMSFKYGDFEGERDGRFFLDMNESKMRSVLDTVKGISIVEEWITDDVMPNRELRWYNVIIRKNRQA